METVVIDDKLPGILSNDTKATILAFPLVFAATYPNNAITSNNKAQK